ncbi:cold shock domain-containing protein [Acinetobacter baumannii]|nr:cold shock domain-containing protein [Acinetobacter baumannii]
MRDQGRLVEWFDEKGYGFIQPDDAEKERVFFAYQRFCTPRTSANYWLCTGISGNP